jgi:hypothetical protein
MNFASVTVRAMIQGVAALSGAAASLAIDR